MYEIIIKYEPDFKVSEENDIIVENNNQIINK